MYAAVPGPFPPLYEALVLSYRWPEVDLGGFARLLGNPPGPSLKGLVGEITRDPVLTDVLFARGLVPFGRASDRYDPVCFDTARRRPDGDCPVLRVEHEAALCDGRIVEQWEMADSFRLFVEVVVAGAEGLSGGR